VPANKSSINSEIGIVLQEICNKDAFILHRKERRTFPPLAMQTTGLPRSNAPLYDKAAARARAPEGSTIKIGTLLAHKKKN